MEWDGIRAVDLISKQIDFVDCLSCVWVSSGLPLLNLALFQHDLFHYSRPLFFFFKFLSAQVNHPDQTIQSISKRAQP